MSVESKLLSLGLSEKEVAVYMAMLYLGPSTAQEISTRARVNRATTYVMIDSLVDKGLSSQITKEKKTYFQAEDPLELLKVLEAKKADVEEKMGEARLIIPELQELYNLNRTKANVRLLEGRESIKIIQNDLARSKAKEFDNITNLTIATEKYPVTENDHRRVYYKKNFKVRTIFSYDATQPVPKLEFLKNEERRMIPQEKFPIFGEVLLYDNKVAMINLEDRLYGIIIEDKFLHDTFKTIFDLAWESAEKYKVKGN